MRHPAVWMCNHYEKNLQVLVWATSAIPKLALPDPVPEVPIHTWPKYPAPVIVDDGGAPKVQVMRWGVWPFFAREKPQAITNARDDKLLVSPTWKQSVAKRRCLIPATSYYEPGQGPPGARGELRFTIKARPHFFFAGLWDTDPDGSGTRGFAMVTTSPNEYAAPFHDRMPVVLPDAHALAWLGSTPLAADNVLALTRPPASDAMDHTVIFAVPKGKITRADIQAGGELDLS